MITNSVMGYALINITFAYPWVLLLLIIPVLLIIWYVKRRSNKRAFLQLSTIINLKYKSSLKPILYHTLFALRYITISLVIIALARPHQEYEKEFIEGNGIDIILCNDISASMEALDFVPNRMEAAKHIAEDFIRTRIGDRVGIVVFGSYPVTLCPLTTDTSAVITQLNTIKIGEYDAEHSFIASGLATCINRLKDSKIKSKIIILLSDGVSDPDLIPIDTVIALAQRYSIKIYSIGIGINGEVPVLFSIRDSTGITSTSIEYRDFGFNEYLLKEIANRTGGVYSYSKDSSSLGEAYNAINELEKSDIKTSTQKMYTDKSLLVIYVGFFILLIELIFRYSVFKKFP